MHEWGISKVMFSGYGTGGTDTAILHPILTSTVPKVRLKRHEKVPQMINSW